MSATPSVGERPGMGATPHTPDSGQNRAAERGRVAVHESETAHAVDRGPRVTGHERDAAHTPNGGDGWTAEHGRATGYECETTHTANRGQRATGHTRNGTHTPDCGQERAAEHGRVAGCAGSRARTERGQERPAVNRSAARTGRVR
ncbi:hypothetical protein NWFMUON74_33170 [Nocardia wallacei]|uniref:Uncharacterized protein n=1 Tax=Nocardia wallacei TaxID=480035 RepID=A0A7G1KJX3_9NOCA|nr:hypothetical protein NWFMUON74_33170 [Nocardia wallacei]